MLTRSFLFTFFLAVIDTAVDMKEKQESAIVIEDVAHEDLKLILDYIYGETIELAMSNVHSLLEAATMLQINAVIEICSDFILDNLNEGNCLSWKRLLQFYNHSQGANSCHRYAINHFGKILCDSEGFASCSFEELSQLIASDHLIVRSEHDVCEAVIKWVKLDLEERKGFLPDLLRHVRWMMIKENYLYETILKEPLVSSSPECMNILIKEVFVRRSSIDHQDSSIEKPCEPRKAEHWTQSILVAGANFAAYFDCSDRVWHEVDKLMKKRIGLELVSMNGQAYALGGFYKKSYKMCGEVFNLAWRHWTLLDGRMGQERCFFGAAHWNDSIYAVGGRSK